MPQASLTVIVPTLTADEALDACVQSVHHQEAVTLQLIVVDNSGRDLVRGRFPGVHVISNRINVGFGAAINQGIRASSAPLVATLNDDAVAAPDWANSLVAAAQKHEDGGMFASQVRLAPSGLIDSAGMLLCADGSSKQKGHGMSPESFAQETTALLPSGSAALYRRAMLDETGAFDDDFFLYCEDTDLGLRALWRGWQCYYVPSAIVHHRYSHSAGRVSPLKAYYVERNRLFLIVKNFTGAMLVAAPVVAVQRYLWHLFFMIQGKGAAAGFAQGSPGWLMVWLVLKAHAALLRHLPRLLRQRKWIRRQSRLNASQFQTAVRQHSISAKQVAAH